ncbi:MAG: ferric reductase-like transmembrane domain-containing protein [Neomegalonema sp.]|nr:ferric reductase-like transmembrane domain-containing protein [Neomegalonema sp.]
MSVRYEPVLWWRAKWVYDAVLILAAGLYVYLYIRVAPAYSEFTRPVDIQILRMRATGTCAFLMLTAILCIGPLARLDARFLPLLYNRRHFGVLTFAMALAHAWFVLDWYFNYSSTPKLIGLFTANTSYGQVLGFPFEIFGVFALAVLFILAATSHDFWLSFLTPPVWKALHMLIYPAYASVVAHIAFGYLQDVENGAFAIVVVGCAATVLTLHLITGLREGAKDAQGAAADESGWVEVGAPGDIPENRAKIVTLAGGERVAVFRYDGKVSAVTNVCAHQNGPLGEGKIVAGCVTCPWHGHQFDPATGRAPAPFTDKIATYRVRLLGGIVFVHEQANAPGTAAEPIILTTSAAEGA